MPNTMSLTSSIWYSRSFLQQVWTLWDHSFLSYAADKQKNETERQTNKQTCMVSNVLPTPTDIVGVGTNREKSQRPRRRWWYHMWALSSSANLHKLHIQNSLARTVTGKHRHEHITPVLARLHWLPVKYRVHFKLAVITFNAVTRQQPS